MRTNEERDALITDNMKLVYYLISRYYPKYIKNEDVIQEGLLGLVQAAATWDETGSKFSTYASTCILNQIRYYFRREKNQLDTVSLDEVCHVEEDGSKIILLDTLVGEENINLAESCIMDFYDSLSDENKLILELSMDLTHKEIGEQLNLPRSTVTKRLLKIKQDCIQFYENNTI